MNVATASEITVFVAVVSH